MKRTVFLLFFIFTIGAIFASGQDQITRPDTLWREIDDASLQRRQLARPIVPNSYRAFTLNKTALGNLLRTAPMEFTEAARNDSPVITIPMPDGAFARFYIEESPIFEARAVTKYPEIKTYRARGIDDPTATARFDFMPTGFHAIILSPKGTVLVDPYAIGETSSYISYFKSDAENNEEFACHFRNDVEQFTSVPDLFPDAPNVVSGANLRTYRLALAATAEYTNVFRQGTDTDAQARARALEQMVVIMNRVNGVYEREVSITMRLVSNEDMIIYTDPTTDPYTNGSGSTMLGENQSNLDTVIGTANYDIGHVFSTGGGGIAGIRVPCGSGKARGVTGLPFPVGDPFAIDYVAHEMGHQFGGFHTFNGVAGSCGSNISSGAAYEPGSGVTIMGYAGICSSQNLSLSSIDTFHVKSIEQIVSFSTTTGNACATGTSTGNTPPEVTIDNGGFTIPKQTPFFLSATATDAEGDALTYDWQEYDLGASATTVPNSDEDGQERPLFRSFLPTTERTRTFPRLIHILNNNNRPPNTTGGRLTGEILPSISRTMIFQVIVRDNRANGGGVRSRAAVVNIDGTSGPLAVTAPNTALSWAGNSSQTVTWDV
ncbi:MAG: M12 family metallo-peptidase, partial [Acidobacteriota bacterium]|nr:M12 family metallo-peptidase [Acidobacteriota bacterium]